MVQVKSYNRPLYRVYKRTEDLFNAMEESARTEMVNRLNRINWVGIEAPEGIVFEQARLNVLDIFRRFGITWPVPQRVYTRLYNASIESANDMGFEERLMSDIEEFVEEGERKRFKKPATYEELIHRGR